MPVAQCQTCGYVVIDPSKPCPSCGNMGVQSPPESSARSTDFDGDGALIFDDSALEFNFGAVLARSFSAFFRHWFVFVGLCFLSQLLGVVTTLLTGMKPGLINTIFGLAIQGAVIYGVYDALRGNPVSFSRSLSKGLERSWALFKVSIGLGICSFVLFVAVLAVFVGRGALFTIPFFCLAAWLWCQWSMFAPACVIEHLEPLGSLFRSSILTRGCRLKTAGLYLLCFLFSLVLIFIFTTVLGLFVKNIGNTTARMIGQLFASVPLALFHVTTAVIYYELLYAKEGRTLDDLESVIYEAEDYAG